MNFDDLAAGSASTRLRQRREQEIDAQYERAYAGVEDPLGKDFEGWENEGVWPSERCQSPATLLHAPDDRRQSPDDGLSAPDDGR